MVGRPKKYHTLEEKQEALKSYRLKYSKSEKIKATKKRYIQRILNDPIKGPIFKAKKAERDKKYTSKPKTEEQTKRRKLWETNYRKNNPKYQAWAKNYRKEYYIKYRAKILKEQKEYYADNPDKLEEQTIRRREYHTKYKEYFKAHRQKPEVKKQIQATARKYQKNKRKTDPIYKIRMCLSSRLNHALRGELKAANTMKLVGCSVEFLKQYLENQFKPGMTWQNHTVTGWHIDHIMPCSIFDLSKPEKQKECFHYTNLQPLWYDENIRKSNKV